MLLQGLVKTPVYNRGMFEERLETTVIAFVKRREWDSEEKTAMLHIRRGDSDVLLWAKLETSLRRLAALMKAKRSLTLGFQSCVNNIHIYVKN